MANTTRTALMQRLTHGWHHPLTLPALLLLALSMGMLGWKYNVMSDHTHNHRNTLSADSLAALQALPAPIEITAFCSNTPFKGRYFRKAITSLVQRYQSHHPALHLQFVDPSHEPTRARTLGIQKEGELIIAYRGQQKRLYLPYTEEALTNLLLQLQHGDRTPLRWVTAPGAAALTDSSASGASHLAEAMQTAGLAITASRLPQAGVKDSGAGSTLVLAGGKQAYSPQQVQSIQQHVRHGGNLIWLVDTPTQQGLQALADTLQISVSPGIIIDPANRQFELPLHALNSLHYSGLGPTQGFALRTFFDAAHALKRSAAAQDGWRTLPLVAAAPQGWVSQHHSLAPPSTAMTFNPLTDIAGPATVALALERARADHGMQRVMIIGSASFFNNAQISKGGNLAFSLQSLQWVANSAPALSLPQPPLRDTVVLLPEQRTWLLLLFNGFQFGLPLLLAAMGTLVWVQRRQR